MPDGLKSINNSAFEDCKSLENINFPSSLAYLRYKSFKGCKSLSKVVLNGTVAIGECAFKDCDNLTVFEIIDENSQNDYIHVHEDFYLDISIEPNNTIGSKAFCNCTNLEEIIIPDHYDYIGSNAFENCTSLSQILLPSKIKSIYDYTFYNCKLLNEINIPLGVNNINEYAFGNCINLRTIEIPCSVTKIETRSFYGCSNLESIHVSKINDSFASEDGILYNKKMDTLICVPPSKKMVDFHINNKIKTIYDYALVNCIYINNIIIENEYTNIGVSSFENCYSLKEISLPKYLEVIPSSAFSGCKLLSKLNLPNELRSIGEQAFDGCSNLIQVNIPDSITFIDDLAFRNCTSLEIIKIGVDKITDVEFGEHVFEGIDYSNCIVYIPFGTKHGYLKHFIFKKFENIKSFNAF